MTNKDVLKVALSTPENTAKVFTTEQDALAALRLASRRLQDLGWSIEYKLVKPFDQKG